MNPLILMPMVAGAVYIGSCEFRAKGPGECDQQWIAGFALMGIGPATRAGFEQGFWKLNPELRKPEDSAPLPERRPEPMMPPPMPPDEWDEIERMIAMQEERNAPEDEQESEPDLLAEPELTTAERMARAAARLHSKKP
jgi:hypothetical protein